MEHLIKPMNLVAQIVNIFKRILFEKTKIKRGSLREKKKIEKDINI
jgi:hypothetical protein